MIRALAVLASLMLVQTASADTLTNRCISQFYQQTARDLAKTPRKPGAPRNLGEEQKLEPFSASIQMLKALAIEACILKDVGAAIVSGKNTNDICAKGLHKLDCYRSWISKRPVNYSSLVPLYMTTATSLAEKDKAEGVDPQVVLAKLIDVALIPFENLDEHANAVFKPIVMTPAMKKTAADFHWPKAPEAIVQDEQFQLQKVERELFAKNKTEFLGLIQKSVTQLRSNKAQAGTAAVLEQRVKKLQAKSL